MELKELMTEQRLDCRLSVNTIGRARTNTRYKGVFSLDRKNHTALFFQTIKESCERVRNKKLVDLQDGCKLFKLQRGGYRFEIVVNEENMSKAVVTDIVNNIFKIKPQK